jgi:lipopolysaccharide transport system ATP-binding protein
MTLLTSDQDTFEQPQDDEVVLSVKNVSKRFCRDLKKSLFYGIQDIAGEVLGARRKDVELRKGEFWALNDVSFELRRGEALGLVGANGAGKTTLLRIISGLIKPDHGSVEIQGRVAPLIALGAGFNPILTGRENIYVNMSILGLSKKEIDERFDQVVEFAEIGEAIDAPVQSYSSGMAARLGFASAIHTEPAILLIDEVLAVGDIKFRVKCYRKLAQLRQKGVSFVLVSHSPQSILSVCDSAIYLQKGQLVTKGATESILSKYEEDLFSAKYEQSFGILQLPRRNPLNEINFLDICFKNSDGNILNQLESGDSAYLSINFNVLSEIDNVSFTFLVKEFRGESDCVLQICSNDQDKTFKFYPGKYELQFQMPYVGFRPSYYTMKIKACKGNIEIIDFIESFNFLVKGEKMSNCMFYQPRLWHILKKNSN